jgi:hypothetical protein
MKYIIKIKQINTLLKMLLDQIIFFKNEKTVICLCGAMSNMLKSYYIPEENKISEYEYNLLVDYIFDKKPLYSKIFRRNKVYWWKFGLFEPRFKFVKKHVRRTNFIIKTYEAITFITVWPKMIILFLLLIFYFSGLYIVFSFKLLICRIKSKDDYYSERMRQHYIIEKL